MKKVKAIIVDTKNPFRGYRASALKGYAIERAKLMASGKYVKGKLTPEAQSVKELNEMESKLPNVQREEIEKAQALNKKMFIDERGNRVYPTEGSFGSYEELLPEATESDVRKAKKELETAKEERIEAEKELEWIKGGRQPRDFDELKKYLKYGQI